MNLEFLINLQPLLLRVLPVLLTVWLGYRLGLLTYFDKRDHEIIKNRYLDNCVDLLTANFDKALHILRVNISTIQQAFHEYELALKCQFSVPKQLVRPDFKNLDTQLYTIAPFFKLQTLIGDPIIHKAYELLLSDVWTTKVTFEYIWAVIEKNYELMPERLDQSHANNYCIVESQEKKLNSYARVLWSLQRIASLIETKPMKFKDLDDFKKNKEIKQIINATKEDLANIEKIRENPIT